MRRISSPFVETGVLRLLNQSVKFIQLSAQGAAVSTLYRSSATPRASRSSHLFLLLVLLGCVFSIMCSDTVKSLLWIIPWQLTRCLTTFSYLQMSTRSGLTLDKVWWQGGSDPSWPRTSTRHKLHVSTCFCKYKLL